MSPLSSRKYLFAPGLFLVAETARSHFRLLFGVALLAELVAGRHSLEALDFARAGRVALLAADLELGLVLLVGERDIPFLVLEHDGLRPGCEGSGSADNGKRRNGSNNLFHLISSPSVVEKRAEKLIQLPRFVKNKTGYLFNT